jgi:nitroimidazol reductase NimA-like FMN-containing flavoprotein (pyridoxamine 5'-phosphate oxidase superfamily)
MPTVTGAWSSDECASFLQSHDIPLRLACTRPDGSLWLLSLWYRYRDGVFECATAADADVVRFLERDDRVAFEVSTNTVPYKGVRGSGSATVDREGGDAVLRDLLERYLGGTDSDLARWLLRDDREEVRLVLDPDRLHSWDYTDRMTDVDS